MENNGDITRTEDERDKRTKHVHLTEAGQKKLKKMHPLKMRTTARLSLPV
jgi:hypothetical protein